MKKQTFRFGASENNEDERDLFPANGNDIDENLRAVVHCSLGYISAMLQKMRQPGEEFFVDIEIKKSAGGSGKLIHLTYLIIGPVIKGEAWKVCHHSIQKYCPLGQTMQKTGAKITWNIKVGSLK